MSADLHWGRETFALAIAVQNLMWGIATPFAGMFADRFGSHRWRSSARLLYVAGLASMAMATTPLMLVLTAGVLIGTGLSPDCRSRSSPACSAASSRPKSAAWRSGFRRPQDRSASSRCFR